MTPNSMQLKLLTKDKHRRRTKLNAKLRGSVVVRGGKLWVDFFYFGERVRESSGLNDTPLNRELLRKRLNLIMAAIENQTFEFSVSFPNSRKKEHFSMLEHTSVKHDPRQTTIGNYFHKWFKDMRQGMSKSNARDYQSIFNYHILPDLGTTSFADFNFVRAKRFVAHIIAKKNRHGQPLSPKRVQIIVSCLRVVVTDGINEYGWSNQIDPFSRLKLPPRRRFRVNPFSVEEWRIFRRYITPWYQPYFDFAVQTGMRPSEQTGFKKYSVGDRFIYAEESRVNGVDKLDLKTEGSRRSIPLTDSLRAVLRKQETLTAAFDTPYVFLNMRGNPINQNTLREVWESAVKRSGLPHRRMYETRHTFASWALDAGESPGWVAAVLGHTDMSMLFRVYGNWVRNPTRRDGSALEAYHSRNAVNEDDES